MVELASQWLTGLIVIGFGLVLPTWIGLAFVTLGFIIAALAFREAYAEWIGRPR